MRTLSPFCAALLLVPAMALADTRVDERHNVAAGGRIELSNVAGKVTVRGWDRNDVQLTGTLSDGLQLRQEKSANRVRWEIEYPRRGNNGGATLTLNVPRSVELLLSTVSADQDISGVDVRRLQADTVSGNLAAAGRSGDSVLNTVSGNVTARLQTPRLDVNTVSGRIEAGGGVSGEIGAQTVSGRVGVDAGRIQRLVVETVSGGIDLSATALAPGGRINVESVSASVSLRLPRTVSAQLSVNSFSGSINSDAGKVERPRYGPGSSLDARLGSGDGDIRVQSHSGSVQVRLDR
ncbi:DUF4097 family beta strand repeat-containing protein [Stenotrophomonas indicatrix]|jgi:DUF4097 and DUF4098 domain-containing protein YvlB|uniref:DUF4097 family beta strand repeat-containing protein n=1 Tax=Stenotrophomonas indicatrix TaxID=2045451 RepID=A0ABT8QKN0_9GAMM|nr:MULTISPECIES: DUF4097 family beta strand repeat-containing protein [Stenotrophomonas]PJL07887.1 hypothetical protein B9Y68_13550 [Stenotrophomonas maltophilia]MBA0097853.1 DUF4097 family beta strand repeat protein [Stenotrophomonas indicatrix]MDH6332481.1 DUF4097 and DUF4098 domain-containing protein YvlB [Stenotrophomonas sp. 1278]MDN8662602.1 DUF4097 family beta strand repeat-containing protein [Stenotrophomonas indicatrix]MDN8671748.1 DUF4097 family beta strand repeat-containing protein 